MVEPFMGTFEVSEIESAVNTDAIIIGVPYEDKTIIYIEGTDEAPNKIREISHNFSGQSFTSQNIHSLNVLDYGNIEIGLPYDESVEKLSRKISEILKKNSLPIVLGGDHSIALGTATGILKSETKIDAIVWLDAHLDLMNEYPEKEKYTRATVLKRIIELGIIKPENIYYIGSRGHNLGLEEIELIKNKEQQLLESKDFNNQIKVYGFLENLKKKHSDIYLSLDIDVLDPAFAPGVSVPEPGGLSTRELLQVVQSLAKQIKCFELVEVNPKLDFNNMTSNVACKVIFELFDSL